MKIGECNGDVSPNDRFQLVSARNPIRNNKESPLTERNPSMGFCLNALSRSSWQGNYGPNLMLLFARSQYDCPVSYMEVKCSSRPTGCSRLDLEDRPVFAAGWDITVHSGAVEIVRRV